MKTRYLVSGLLLFFTIICTFPLYTQELLVDYVLGTVEKREGTQWIMLFDDDIVDIQTFIRLQEDSMVELSGDNINITIIKPGTYDCKKIIEDTQKADSFGIGDIISAKFSAFTDDGDMDSEGAVMGVRAANIEAEADFIGDDIIEEIFRISKKKIAREEYQGAIPLLEEAYDLGDINNEGIFLYYIGYCYNKLGNEIQAITYLMDVDIKHEMPFYPDYVLLFGSLLIRSFALEDALALFLDYHQVSEQTDAAIDQDIHYLTALCYIQMDNLEDAFTFLKKTKSIDPDTETGKKAESLLKDLR